MYLWIINKSGYYGSVFMHLKDFQKGIKVRQFIKQGDVIGFVGKTGNASNSVPHLHFGVAMLKRKNCLKELNFFDFLKRL